MSSVQHENSIHQFICLHSSVDPDNAKDLGLRWMNLCEELGIDLHYVRRKMDTWFMDAYALRNQLPDIAMDTSTGRMQTKKDELFRRFFDDFDDIIRNEDFFEKIQMGAAKDKIKSKYAACPDDWVDLAVRCVSAEFDLLKDFVDRRQQYKQVQQANEKIEQDINDASQIQMRINDGVKALGNRVSTLRDLTEKQEENQGHLRDLQVVSHVLLKQNGKVPDQQHFKTLLQQIGEEIISVTGQAEQEHQQVLQMFQELYSILAELVSALESKVKEWQQEFKFDYAELAATVNLQNQVAPWCARTGKIIYDVLHESMMLWQNTLSNLPSDRCESLNEQCSTMEVTFQSMMSQFIQRTFVVTEQGNFFIKTGNKRFPKFCVRVLAADHFSRRSEESTAHFVSEEDLKSCWKKNKLDLKMMQKMERKLRNNKLKFTTENGRDKMECSFQNLQFEHSFKRSQKEQYKQVHEEKYRVIFTTKVEETPCWTLSLPLVVTTASNQEAHSLASIMWQCFATDVFNPASDIPEELPWSKVAQMLQTKMSRLSTSHRLSNENITHLKNRLFGEDNLPDDTPVTLTDFCWSAMQDTEFSFWKWFLGVYNLVEQYLQQFWHDGLIMGFIKKEAAEVMLEKCDKAGAFILRFSDKLLTNSDGRRSIYGRLASCVVVMKLKLLLLDQRGGFPQNLLKGERSVLSIDVHIVGNKRNSFGQLETVKRKVVEHVDVADFKKLSGELKKFDTEEGQKNNLANILKGTSIKSRDGNSQVPMYCCLYPNGKSREELFDKYCEEDVTVSGYRHTRVTYIAILEQTMSKMTLAQQKEESVDTDTNVQLGAVKKARRVKDTTDRVRRSPRRSSSCHSSISTPQGSPLFVQSPQTPSQSLVYPSQSPGYPCSSPAWSVSSPAVAMHLQQQPSTDPMSVHSDNIPLLPTVIGENFSRPISIHANGRNTLGKMSSSSLLEVKETDSVPVREVMEVSPDNMPFINSPPQLTCTEAQNQTFTLQLFDHKTPVVGGDFASVIGDHTILDGADMPDGGTEFLENPQVIIMVNNNGQLERTKEDTTGDSQPSTDQMRQLVSNYLSTNLPQSQFQQVQTWLEWDQVSAETFVQPAPVSDAGLTNTPVTSSGSSGDLFGYSGNQLAAMGSGDIDPNFTNSLTESDT